MQRVQDRRFPAPCVLLICSDSSRLHKMGDGHDCGLIDAAIVTTHMMLEAFDEGIGTCWVRRFEKHFVLLRAEGMPYQSSYPSL